MLMPFWTAIILPPILSINIYLDYIEYKNDFERFEILKKI